MVRREARGGASSWRVARERGGRREGVRRGGPGPVHAGLRKEISRQYTMVRGQYIMVSGQYIMVSTSWSVHYGQYIMVSTSWSVLPGATRRAAPCLGYRRPQHTAGGKDKGSRL